jgi:hypothetical protein
MQGIGCFGLLLIAILLTGIVVLLQSVEGVILALLVAGVIGLIALEARKSRRRRLLTGYGLVSEKIRSLQTSRSGLTSTWLKTQADETVFIELDNVKLREYKSNSSTTAGGFGGATFQISKNVGVFGGGGSSRTAADPETSTVLDVGKVAFTNQRVVFVGPNQNREWLLDNLLSSDISETGDRVKIATSDREKVSELQGDIGSGAAVALYFAIAESMHKGSQSETTDLIRSLVTQLDDQIAQMKAQYKL